MSSWKSSGFYMFAAEKGGVSDTDTGAGVQKTARGECDVDTR